MLLRARHHTRFKYPIPSIDSHNEVRLKPLNEPTQRCLRFSLDVSPATAIFSYETNGGTVHYFNIREPHTSLEIVATALVETFPINPYEGLNLLEPDWDFYAQEDTRQSYAEFLAESPYVTLHRESARIAEDVRMPDTSVVKFLLDLNEHLYRLLEYDPDATHVHSRLDEVILKRAGVCQDYAHLMISCCRTQGIPARYVSGYLYGGEGIRGEQGTHAWVDCLLPDGRWLALDPTNKLLANSHHIRVHVGRDYSEVTPTRGVYVGAASTSLDFGVSVQQVAEVESAVA
jgi:transglutaminase-like putative cysteine protease